MQDDQNLGLAVFFVFVLFLWFKTHHMNWLKILLGFIPDYCGNMQSVERCEQLVDIQKDIYKEFAKNASTNVKFDCENSKVDEGEENLVLTEEAESFLSKVEEDLEPAYTELNTVDGGKVNNFEKEVMKRLRNDAGAPVGVDAFDLFYDDILVTTFKNQFCTYECFEHSCVALMRTYHLEGVDPDMATQDFFVSDPRYHTDYQGWVMANVAPLFGHASVTNFTVCELMFFWHFYSSLFEGWLYNERDLSGSCYEHCKSDKCTGERSDDCPSECQKFTTELPIHDGSIFNDECDVCGCKDKICPGDFKITVTFNFAIFPGYDALSPSEWDTYLMDKATDFAQFVEIETSTYVSFYILYSYPTPDIIFHVTDYTNATTKESLTVSINNIGDRAYLTSYTGSQYTSIVVASGD
ncbi:MAG: hypothetical protein CMB64_05280 [Euryarchaeota archaeon]|nr:hypothetical protein [Euryarchaeota archaeon]|tara:strand:+ start:1519 stop:2748 length:1230 start_codon:yes stop_codon:yes gene_type:complete